MARTRRTDPDRRTSPTAHLDRRRRAHRRRGRAAQRHVVRHAERVGAVSRRSPWQPHSTPATTSDGSTTRPWVSRSTRPPPSTTSQRSSPHSAARRSSRHGTTRCRTASPHAGRRTDDFLTQSVFDRYHSEHEMLRYLRRLSDRDLALDRTMIPLGSCTMKLNATSEMVPITWPEFADIHPFAPTDQVAGLPRTDRRPRAASGHDHRLRRREPAAERRQPGRVRRAAGDPCLPPLTRRRPANRLPHPVERPRHERRERRDGRHGRGGRGLRRLGQRRSRRRARQDRRGR